MKNLTRNINKAFDWLTKLLIYSAIIIFLYMIFHKYIEGQYMFFVDYYEQHK